MTTIIDKFTTNALQTPLGLMISRASDEILPTEDWTLIMEICDYINTHEEGPKDATRALRKRLSMTKTSRSTLYALTILETCMKNCGYRFQVHVCQKDYIQDLVKLLQPARNPSLAIQERVVSMIQNWSDAFSTHPDLKGVVIVQQELKSKGVIFPPSNPDEVANLKLTGGYEVGRPRNTPHLQNTQQPVVSDNINGRVGPPEHTRVTHPTPGMPSDPVPSQPHKLNQSQLHKLRKDLDVVMANTRIFSDMLTQLTPGQEEAAEYQLLKDVNSTCRQMQSRLVELVENVPSEEITMELLRINDELNSVFVRYDRYERIREVHLRKTQSAAQDNTLIPGLPAPVAPVRNKSLPSAAQSESLYSNLPARPEASSIDAGRSNDWTSQQPKLPARMSNIPKIDPHSDTPILEPLPSSETSHGEALAAASNPTYEELFIASSQQPFPGASGDGAAEAPKPTDLVSTSEFDDFLQSRSYGNSQSDQPKPQ